MSSRRGQRARHSTPNAASGAETHPDRRRHQRRLSDILEGLASEGDAERVSIDDLLATMRDRAFGALLFIFAVPNVLPVMLPGASGILGIPLIFLSAQLMLGYSRPRLPRWISQRSLGRQDLNRFVGTITPRLARIERLLRPRLEAVTGTTAERVIGAVCLVLAIVLSLPIPLGNVLPALAIALLALGILEKDGMAVLLGGLIGLVSLVVVSGVVYGMVKAALFILKGALAQ